MCGYICIGFTDFMLKGKSLLEYINLFFGNEYEKNDQIVLIYVSVVYKKVKITKLYCIVYDK